MSNQPENPWASQDPNWRPSQFGDAQGRDPRQPFGQQAPQQPGYGYQELQPPRRPNRSMWVVLAAVGIVAALIIGMQFFGAPAPEEPQPTQTASGTAAPSPTRTGNFIPFEGNGDGIFEIVSASWDGEDQLNLRVRVEVTGGEYSFALFAFTNDTRASYDPVDPGAFSASEDAPFEGDVTFIMPKADSTIVLTTPSGRIALNALPVKG